MPSSATRLAEAGGTVTSDHSFATTADDPNDIMGHSSLWWEWQAPAAGWAAVRARRLGVDGSRVRRTAGDHRGVYDRRWRTRPRRHQRPLLRGQRTRGSHLPRRGGGVLRRQGRPAGQRTSARGPGRRPFSYAPVDPPAWQRYVGSVVEAGDPAAQPVDDLDNPRGVALETGRNRLVVASERNLLLFEHRQTDLPTVSDVISLRTADGEGIGHASRWGLVWDEANTEMYLVAERRDLPGWRARRGNSGCHRLRPRPKGSQLPTIC